MARPGDREPELLGISSWTLATSKQHSDTAMGNPPRSEIEQVPSMREIMKNSPTNGAHPAWQSVPERLQEAHQPLPFRKIKCAPPRCPHQPPMQRGGAVVSKTWASSLPAPTAMAPGCTIMSPPAFAAFVPGSALSPSVPTCCVTLATSGIGGLIAGAALEANDGPLHLATKGAHAAIPVGVIARLGLISGPLPAVSAAAHASEILRDARLP